MGRAVVQATVSFREFLVSPQEEDFRVAETKTHERLLETGLWAMKNPSLGVNAQYLSEYQVIGHYRKTSMPLNSEPSAYSGSEYA